MAIREIQMWEPPGYNGDLPSGANPGFEKSCCVNPHDKYLRGRGLSPHENMEFYGICSVSSDQFLQCYYRMDCDITPAILAEYCKNCPYCLSPKHIAGDNTIVLPNFICNMPEVDKENDFPKSYVYFISDGQFIKIGVAKDPKARLNGIQTGNPRECKILSLIPCISDGAAHTLEKRLHYIYRRQKIRGEWFDLIKFLNIDTFQSVFDPQFYLNTEESNA